MGCLGPPVWVICGFVLDVRRWCPGDLFGTLLTAAFFSGTGRRHRSCFGRAWQRLFLPNACYRVAPPLLPSLAYFLWPAVTRPQTHFGR